MRITAMKTSHVENPLGYELAPMSFSWKVDRTQSAAAVSARVEVARDKAFSELIHDSGHATGISNAAYSPEGLTLAPRSRYWWRVTVRGDRGDEASTVAWFETGKMEEPWAAKWVASPLAGGEHPCFRKSFTLQGDIASARAYACGLGVYELYVNGAKAGDENLAPGFHVYDKWLQVQAYDLTSLLRPGENVLGGMLGNGWAKGRFGPGDAAENFCGEFGFIAEVHVTYANGETLVLATGEDWLCAASPVLESSIYDGETYDATLEQPGWASAGFDAAGWQTVVVAEDFQEKWGLGPLCDCLSLPVKVMQELKPAALLKTPAGEDVLDMGQNMVGFLRFKARAPEGRKQSLYFGELLQEGNFYRDNLRSAKAEYHYISSGTAAEVRPLFTFYGFRYVKLEGFGDIDINDFTGCVLYSAMEPTGRIETSDAKVNRLFQNVLWGQRGNFLDVPTDCPQRDERMGWTGDAQIFCETAAWNMDVSAFFTKYLRDMAYEQEKNGGRVPHVIPDVYPRKTEKSKGGGACGWADAAAVIPWTLYQMYGDEGILRAAFPGLRAWVDWVKAEDDRSGGRRLWTTGFHFGDWLAVDAPVPGGVFGATDVAFIASAYYFYSASLTAKTARVLNDTESAAIYEALAGEIKAAIGREFFTPSGRLAVKTQTAMALALHFGIYPEGCRERLAQDLKLQLVRDGMKLKTGFLGTPALCRALTENEGHAYALRLFFNEELPGWLYAVNMGATTVWERWDSVLPDGKLSDTGMNSLNHYAYGSVASWMYRYLCGIIPLAPGFEEVRLAPRPCGQLDFARACFDSPHGKIVCGWKRLTDGQWEIEAEIPFGVTGELVLTRASQSQKALAPGQHKFTYTPLPAEKCSLETPVYELLANEQAAKIFSAIPGFGSVPENILTYTFGELLDFVKRSFPHLEAAAGMLAQAILNVEREC